MKFIHRWLQAILCFAMLVLLAACATIYIPTHSSLGNMSVKEARKEIVSGLVLVSQYVDIDARITTNRLVVTETKKYSGGTDERHVTNFSELTRISGYSQGGTHRVELSDGNKYIVWNASDMRVACVANAFYVLKENALKAKKAADEYEAFFAASLADYRKTADSNAVLPEEANKYKVQAEGAVRDKAFDDAADFYATALKIAPWWSVGHFNRALVLGETGDYELAMREMNYYLQLVPDAPNARAAQNQIYEWERMESR